MKGIEPVRASGAKHGVHPVRVSYRKKGLTARTPEEFTCARPAKPTARRSLSPSTNDHAPRQARLLARTDCRCPAKPGKLFIAFELGRDGRLALPPFKNAIKVADMDDDAALKPLPHITDKDGRVRSRSLVSP